MSEPKTQANNQDAPPALAATPGSASGFWRSARGENHGLNSMPGDVWVVPGDITDTDRLNWLDDEGRIARFSDGWNAWTLTHQTPFIAESPREAIDAAMMQNSD